MNTSINYKKILVPVDFSDCARKAFYIGLAYSKALHAEMVALHVREYAAVVGLEAIERADEEVARMEGGVRRRLDELLASGGLDEVDRARVHLEVAGGRPWVEIVRYANEHDVDLIVMGTHGQTGLKSILIGGQCEKVVRRANCHVLVVKPDGFDSTLDGIPEEFRV